VRSNTGITRRERPGQSRVRVAVNEHPIGFLDFDRRPDAGPHQLYHLLARQRTRFEPVSRLAQPELLEKELRELAVVVLPGVEQNLFNPATFRAAESGADLMNCGLLPTTARIRIDRLLLRARAVKRNSTCFIRRKSETTYTGFSSDESSACGVSSSATPTRVAR